MNRSWHFFKLRLVQFRGDFTSIFFSYGFPIILVLILGFFFSSDDPIKLTVYHTSTNGAEPAEKVLSNLEASPYVELKQADFSMDEGIAKLQDKQIAYLISFEDGAPFTLHYNTLEPQAELNRAAIAAAAEHGAGQIHRTNVVLEKQKPYIYTIFPGTMGLVLLTIALIGAGAVLVEERDLGIFKKLKTIDARPGPFLTGLLLSRLLVCVSLVFVMMVVVHLAFGVNSYASTGPLLITAGLGTCAFLGLALWLAGVSKTQAGYMGMLNLVQLPLIILGGVFFSIEVFPVWLQQLSIFSPLTAFTVCFQEIIYQELTVSGMTVLTKELAILGGWAVFLPVLGIVRFKW